MCTGGVEVAGNRASCVDRTFIQSCPERETNK